MSGLDIQVKSINYSSMIDRKFQHTYSSILETLWSRLEEPAPGRVQLLSGPRQVGKTHLLRALEQRLEDRVVFAAADVTAAGLSGWWEAQWRRAEAMAQSGATAVLMIDEVQYLSDWSRRLKVEYDRVIRENLPVHVVVTGSSSLTLGRDSQETMAGRFEHLRLLHWPASELVAQLGIDAPTAVDLTVSHGTYPGAAPLLDQPDRWRAYVRDAIIEPAIGRDILHLEAVRKPAMLRQVFTLAAAHPAEVISLNKLRGELTDRGALETIAHYLQVLERAYLVAPVYKHSARELRRRQSPPKLIVLNQAIIAAMANDPFPQPGDRSGTYGRWVENACLALAWNSGQQIAYWREEPLEVDLVMSGSWGRWAVEVKTGSFQTRDLEGLLELCRRYPDFRPLVVCNPGTEPIARSAGVAACSWREFLLTGPPV